MKVETIASMADEFDITPELAREILLTYSDQIAPPPPRTEEPEEPEEERKPWPTNSWIKGLSIWNYATDPVWIYLMTTGAGGYTAAKGLLAGNAGLNIRAALPKALGGMTAGELTAARTLPEVKGAFNLWYEYGRPKALRPAIKIIRTGKLAGQRTITAPLTKLIAQGKNIPQTLRGLARVKSLAARAGGRLFGAALPLGAFLTPPEPGAKPLIKLPKEITRLVPKEITRIFEGRPQVRAPVPIRPSP